MLDQGLDVVAVCLPHNMHVEPAVAAADRGIHVMMEKPIATTLADGRRIAAACAESGVKLTISYVHRYREEIQMLCGWLRTGQLGTPVMARETMNVQRGAHLPDWVERAQMAGGGVLMYSAIHGIDRLRWLLDDEVMSVTAQTRLLEDGAEVEHAVVALLTFSRGAIAALTANAPGYPVPPGHWETELFGTEGMARARTRAWAEISARTSRSRHDTRWCADRLGEHYNFVRQAAAFVDAIRTDSAPSVTAEDGLETLAIVETIYASAASNAPVALPR